MPYAIATYQTYNQTTGAVLTSTEVFIPIYNGTLSCEQAEAPYLNLTLEEALAKRALCSLSAPTPPQGYLAAPRNCSPSGLIVTDLGEYSPGSSSALPTVTSFVTANPDIFSPALQWQNGKARLINQVSPTVPGGSSLWYWFSGQPPLSALPTDYLLQPGDEIQLMVAISPTPDVSTNTWTQKANILITVGPAPTA